MSFRDDLDALTTKLALAEVEAERLRARVAELEGDDPAAKAAALAALEARITELEPVVRQVEGLRVTNAGLRARIKELELERKQAAALRAPSTGDAALTQALPILGGMLGLALLALLVLAVCKG